MHWHPRVGAGGGVEGGRAVPPEKAPLSGASLASWHAPEQDEPPEARVGLYFTRFRLQPALSARSSVHGQDRS